MRAAIRWFFVCLMAACASAPVFAQVRVTQGLAYGPFQREQFDLYRPASCPPGGCPLVVWFHGHGGARAIAPGDPKLRMPARYGIAIASCDYRTNASGDPDSVSLYDAKRCRAWAAYNARTWELDSSRVACWGASLGGYLCNWLLTTCGDTVSGTGIPGECVRGGVSLFGASRLVTLDAELNAAGCPPISRPTLADTARARRASPIEYVRPSTPAWMGLHSSDDCVVSVRQTEQLDSALTAAGALSWIRIYSGLGHGGPAWSADSIIYLQLRFLQLVLR